MYDRAIIVIACLLVVLALPSRAQENWHVIDSKGIVSCDTIKQRNNTLIFINKQPGFDEGVKRRLIETFFKVYPLEVTLYNRNAPRKVIFIVDPGYKGVAAAGGEIVRFSPAWFKQNPLDIDVVTHEVMHLVQAYPNNAGPGWITEGIADYVRYTLGIDNAAARWTLPEYSVGQSYTNSYRITARFFYWLEKNGYKGLIKKLDSTMRSNTYKKDFWQVNAGSTIDELWAKYSKKPEIR